MQTLVAYYTNVLDFEKKLKNSSWKYYAVVDLYITHLI